MHTRPQYYIEDEHKLGLTQIQDVPKELPFPVHLHKDHSFFFRLMWLVFGWHKMNFVCNNMRQVQPETLPKNSNCSSCLQNIKLKNNIT